jgi:hypothetical protein
MLYQKGVSRRNFLAGASAVGAASVLAGCSDNGTPAAATTPTTFTDVDYLNFALNLEYLEASFYLYAATGSGLPTASQGTSPGTVTGGAMVTGLTTPQQQILNEIAFDELSHVNFLRAALGSSAVAMPNINIGSAFATVATAAGVSGTFTPYSSFNNFLIGAFIFEDVGVTAYSGAAPALTVSANLNYAAGILAVEAYHAAYIRTTITGIAGTVVSGAQPNASLLTTANQVATLRGTLGGGNETMLTLPPITIAASGNYAPSSIVGFSRTPSQVLHIVYGTGGTTGVASGGFFPNGLNGNIKTTTA